MIPNLRERLRTISSNYHSRVEDIDGKTTRPAHGSLGGHIIETRWGKHVLKRTEVPLGYSYGNIPFERVTHINNPVEHKWFGLNDDDYRYNITDLVFLDTETTGLSRGAGTLAFMVGLGYFNEHCFVIEQHIMRDFDEEFSMLNSILNTLNNRKILISFNGKSYDYPLLENRMIINHISPHINHKEFHIDLLHIARRIWSTMLESCSLISLEKNVLEKHRAIDIPGRDIPGVYYKYLQDRDEAAMNIVIEHNSNDILAMVALFIKLACMYKDHRTSHLHCQEWFGMAKSFEAQGDDEMSSYCYTKSIETGSTPYTGMAARNRLAMLYKRRGQWKPAIKLWKYMVDHGGNFMITPLIEIAKYYEHHEQNYEKALKYTDKAIKRLTHMRIARNAPYGMDGINEIRHRKKRLERKRKSVNEVF
ncbi:MAG: hypothetical protein GX352_04710 [Clostridiales bacterium]|nr:hypothetical protein [Clostridiales bacterium]